MLKLQQLLKQLWHFSIGTTNIVKIEWINLWVTYFAQQMNHILIWLQTYELSWMDIDFELENWPIIHTIF